MIESSPSLDELTFYRELIAVLEVDVPDETILQPGVDLTGDLGMDSLQRFVATIVIEQLAGLPEAPDRVPALETLGDAFEYYGKCSAWQGTGGLEVQT